MSNETHMKCPNCQEMLCTVSYEGVEIETCPACKGEWLDAGELGNIIRLREKRFNEQERQAIAKSATYTAVSLDEADRDLLCPKCGGRTDAVNYGSGSGIIIDKCPACGGIWVDGGELEKIQALAEGWQDMLPEDLKQYGPKMRDIAARYDDEDNVGIARVPLVGGFLNLMVNGIVDIAS